MKDIYEEFPQFKGIPSSVMCRLIMEARLSPFDVQIATQRLVWRMKYPDIGAAVNMDRSGVSKHLRDKIVPQIELVMGYCMGENCIGI